MCTVLIVQFALCKQYFQLLGVCTMAMCTQKVEHGGTAVHLTADVWMEALGITRANQCTYDM